MSERKTVLVIDDDDSLRRVIEYTLDEAGFNLNSVVLVFLYCFNSSEVNNVIIGHMFF